MSDDPRIPSGLPIGYGGPKREGEAADRDRLIEAGAGALLTRLNSPHRILPMGQRECAACVLDALTASPELAGVLARWAAGEAGMSREVEEARHVVVRDFRQPGNDYRVEVECRCGWKGFETSFPLHKATAVQAALAELFARRARFGWDYWGDESLGTAQMPEAK